MLNIIFFIPKVLILGLTMGSVNFFKKKRTAALPEHIFYINVSPTFGIDMKPLIKGITSVLGKDLEDTLTEMDDGFQPGRFIGLRPPPYTDAEGLIEYAQGCLDEDSGGNPFFTPRGRLKTIGMLVSDETLDKVRKSKCLTLYHEEEYTSGVYEAHIRYKNNKFIGAAIKVLMATGELDEECFECESDCGVDEDGDCDNCGTERVAPSTINKTIAKLQKEAA